MNLRSVFALLVAALVVLLGALLPQLAARQLDQGFENTVLVAPVESVNLEFSQNEERTISQTLGILGNTRSTVEIPVELAKLKQDKVQQIVGNLVEQCREAGILLSEAAEGQILSCRVMLCYTQSESEVFWQVTYGDTKGGYKLVVMLDDRTGTVCAMEYADTRFEYEPDYMGTVMESFLEIYLAGLGNSFFDVSPESLLARAQVPEDRAYCATELSWDTGLYGTGRLTFFVNRSGFYTYFNGNIR